MYKIDYEQLDDYERGWLEGVLLYAYMKDGVYYVGTTGRTYKEAVKNFLISRNKVEAFVDEQI